MGDGTADRLSVAIEQQDRGPRVHLSGDIDPHTAESLQRALEPLLESEPERVVLDLSQVQFMDSSGLRQLLTANDRLRQSGGELVLARPSANVLRLLEITDLIGTLSIEDVD